MGFSARYSYDKFDCSLSSRLSLGNYVYNNRAAQAYLGNIQSGSNYLSNIPSSIKDTYFVKTQMWSDYYIENASFFKLDNLSVGYTFDKISKQNIKVRLSATCQNVFTVTKYTGVDPEVSNGIDNQVYPRPRTFLIGLSIDL